MLMNRIALNRHVWIISRVLDRIEEHKGLAHDTQVLYDVQVLMGELLHYSLDLALPQDFNFVLLLIRFLSSSCIDFEHRCALLGS